MADDLTLTLAGVEYQLAPLPWRTVKKIQPVLYRLYTTMQSDGGERPIASLSESDLDALAEIVFTALGHLETGTRPARDAFDDMPITVGEMVRTIPPISRAAGMISRAAPSPGLAQPSSEASGEGGK